MLGKKNFSFLEEKIKEYEYIPFPDRHEDTLLAANSPELEEYSSLEIGMNYLKNGSYVDAINYFEKYSHLYSTSPLFICSLSDSYFKSGNLEYAIKVLEKFSEVNPFNIFVYQQLGNFHYKAGNTSIACKYFEIILKENPNDLDSMIKLSNYYVLCQEYNSAIEILNKLLRFFPLDEKFNLILGLCYIETNRYYEAIIVFEKILIRNSNSDEINASLGGAYFYTGNYEKSIKYFQKALSINRNKSDYFLNLALCYEKTNRLQESISILKEIPENLIDSNIRCLLAKYYIKLGEIQKAIPEIKILKDEYPKLANELFEEIFCDNYKSFSTSPNALETLQSACLKGIEIYIHLKNNRNTYHFMKSPGGATGKKLTDELEGELWRDKIYEIRKDPVIDSVDWFTINKFIEIIDQKYHVQYTFPEKKKVVKNEEYYFRFLDIPTSSSIQEIKSAYKKKLKLYHPDKVASLGKELQEVAIEITKNLTEAYEFIRKRKKF